MATAPPLPGATRKRRDGSGRGRRGGLRRGRMSGRRGSLRGGQGPAGGRQVTALRRHGSLPPAPGRGRLVGWRRLRADRGGPRELGAWPAPCGAALRFGPVLYGRPLRSVAPTGRSPPSQVGRCPRRRRQPRRAPGGAQWGSQRSWAGRTPRSPQGCTCASLAAGPGAVRRASPGTCLRPGPGRARRAAGP